MPDPDREIYPSAPLRFVAFELRFPLAPTLADQATRQTLYQALRHVFPIPEAAPAPIDLSAAAGLSSVFPGAGGDQLRMLDRARTRSVTVGTRSLLLETSAYPQYEVMEEWLRLAVDALAELDEVVAVERIGLRYIDEVRIPGVEAPADWREYFHPALYGPTDLLSPAVARTSQGLVEYVISERQRLVMRYGATAEGGIVNPDGVLRLKTKDRGPYFLIDLDSFWLPPEEELPEFAAETVMQICGELHAPVRTAFEAAITEKLRDDVLRRPSE